MNRLKVNLSNKNEKSLNEGNKVSFFYTDEQKDLFYRLESKNNFNRLKKLSLIVIIIAVLITYFKDLSLNYYWLNFSELITIENLIIVYIFHFFIIFSVKQYICEKISNERKKETEKKYVKITSKYEDKDKTKKEKILVRLKNFLLYIFSPDILLSNEFKNNLVNEAINLDYPIHTKKSQKLFYSIYKNTTIHTYQWSQIRIERKFLIEWANWLNLIITIVSCLVFYVFALIIDSDVFLGIFLSFLIVRVVSRGIEIAYAFYKDVVSIDSKLFHFNYINKPIYVQNFKSSIIRNRTRLSLAVHSLLEIIILFSFIYYLLGMEYYSSGKYYFEDLYQAVLFSASLGVFNYSFDPEYSVLMTMLHVWQIVISGVLILLSIALYIGRDDFIEDELDLYIHAYRKLRYK